MRFLSSHPALIRIVGAFVLGAACVLQTDRVLIPLPTFYGPGAYRATVLLLIWTCLTEQSLQRYFLWSITDALLLSLPWLLTRALPLPFELSTWLLLLPWLGYAWCGALIGVACTQAIQSMNLSIPSRPSPAPT